MVTGRAIAAESPETLARAEAVALGAGPIEVTLAPVSGGSLASRLATLGAERKLYLVLRDVRTNEQPGVLYRIHLGLPRGVAPAPEGFHAVGSLNLFNAGSKPDPSRFQSYEVTDLVRTLLARKAADGAVTVTIVPMGPPSAAARPTIGEIALVAQ